MKPTKGFDRQWSKMGNEKQYAQRAGKGLTSLLGMVLFPYAILSFLGREIVRPFLSVKLLVGGFTLFLSLYLLRRLYVDAAGSVNHGTDAALFS